MLKIQNLLCEDDRARKGVFPTPQIWVEKSQEYLAKVFGDNWQYEYYVWDCCAGTCNLLAGLTNKYNVWASTIDQPDVDIVHELIANNKFNLLESHVFRFDFLNDDFSKLPHELQDIINDEEKRKKLIVYMNPPYAETMSKTGTDKAGLQQTGVNTKYQRKLGNCANRELFVQFLTRIYFEIPESKIAVFSTLKTLNAPNFSMFRSFFRAKLCTLFIVPAYTFDQVNGEFAIGFQIWDTGIKESFKTIFADVFDVDAKSLAKKRFDSHDDTPLINEWLITTRNRPHEKNIGFMYVNGNDFQHNSNIHIVNDKAQLPAPRGIWVTDQNLKETAVYFAVRKCIKTDWLNNRDQFHSPDDGYKTDRAFQTDCLIYTLFHDKIKILCQDGRNHWIPFTATEVDAKDNFQSTYMSDFLKTQNPGKDAKAVFEAGKSLWKYYHLTIKSAKRAVVDASLYEIREYFKGRDKETGRMKTKAVDEQFNVLDAELRASLKKLAGKIQPKVYEYGFLRE